MSTGAGTPAAGDVELDARGMRCPLPVIRLAAVARRSAPGTVVTVLATDPAARHDIAAWCRMRGQELLAADDRRDEELGAFTAYRVLVRTSAVEDGRQG